MNTGVTGIVIAMEHLCEVAFPKRGKTVTLSGDGDRFMRFQIVLAWLENKHISRLPDASVRIVSRPSHTEAHGFSNLFLVLNLYEVYLSFLFHSFCPFSSLSFLFALLLSLHPCFPFCFFQICKFAQPPPRSLTPNSQITLFFASINSLFSIFMDLSNRLFSHTISCILFQVSRIFQTKQFLSLTNPFREQFECSSLRIILIVLFVFLIFQI